MRLELIFKNPTDYVTIVIDGNKMLLETPDTVQQAEQPQLPYIQFDVPVVSEVGSITFPTATQIAEQIVASLPVAKRKGRPPKSDKGLYRFEEWYSLYPRKVSRGQAERTWAALNPSDELIDTMIAAIKVQREQPEWTKDNGAFIPHPSTWINAKRWLDEMPGDVIRTQELPYAGKPWAQFIKTGAAAEVLNLMAQVGVDDADAVLDRLESEGVSEVCDWLWSFRAASV